MDESGQAPSVERLSTLVTERDHEETLTVLDEFETSDPDERKRAVQSLRSIAAEDSALFNGLAEALVPFLEDDERAVRLSTAKLLVAVAGTEPKAVKPVVESVADRLADGEEFYYVRARAAEALGYVALEHPGAVASPETLADLRVGLEFDEPEVKEKLAKALAGVALGDPDRLRHQTARLAEHLDDERTLVRYHLCTAVVAVGCAHPERLGDASDALAERLDDESPYVRGRAAEALGLLNEAATGDDAERPATDGALSALADDESEFAADRARFATGATGDGDDLGTTDLGTLDGVRATTDAAAEAIRMPDADGQCPHCGIALPDSGPPFCPGCGAPH